MCLLPLSFVTLLYLKLRQANLKTSGIEIDMTYIAHIALKYIYTELL